MALKARGVAVVGICNGFQVLTEVGLLPGALLRNAGLKYVCKPVELDIVNGQTRFTAGYGEQRQALMTVGNGEGNYFADEETLDRLEGEGQVVFRYKENPNGSARDIAGITNERGNVVGLMPHPEHAVEEGFGPNTPAAFPDARQAPTGTPPAKPLARVATSGTMPACWKPNHGPVRPMPH